MNLETLLETINRLETISEEEKTLLKDKVSLLQKQHQKDSFKLKRIEKDKDIVTNVLNATITDLERNKKILEKANEELRKQQELIAEKTLLLEKNIRKLESSYKELEEFSYIVSHDLKSPLRTISSFAQLIKKRYYDQLNAEGAEFIDFIVKGVFEMDEVIHALLEYAQVGHRSNVMKMTDLNEVVQVVKSNLRKEIEDHDVVIICPPLPTLTGNRVGLIQLFQNLLSNAIKFSSEHDPIVEISCKKSGDGWLFKVKDNGIGINKEFHQNIFTPFQRLDKQSTYGIGIGLSICKKIVKMHQGEIYVESDGQQGTTFVFSLRVGEKQPQKIKPPSLAFPHPG